MKTVAIATTAGPPAKLLAMTSEQLRAELVKALQVTADSLRWTAWIVRLLEERGDDLSDLKIGILDYLRRIAYGQVTPELVVRYAQSPALLRTLAALPLPDQQKIAAGEPVRVVVRRPDGQFDHRMAEPLKLTRDQVAQVFGRGKIRDDAEQILLLEGRQEASGTPKAKARRAGVAADPGRGGLVVGRKFVDAGSVVSALAELTGDLDASPADVPITVKLTEAEHTALKNAASRAGIPMTVLVRRAMLLHGLFSGE